VIAFRTGPRKAGGRADSRRLRGPHGCSTAALYRHDASSSSQAGRKRIPYYAKLPRRRHVGGYVAASCRAAARPAWVTWWWLPTTWHHL